jgi:hypothetical protein
MNEKHYDCQGVELSKDYYRELIWKDQLVNILNEIKISLQNIEKKIDINKVPAVPSPILDKGFLCLGCGEWFKGEHKCIPKNNSTTGI